MSVEKKYQDGKVAVLVTSGYGAGWSTWNSGELELQEFLLFDKTLVELVLADKPANEIGDYVKYFYPDATISGADNLTVRWVSKDSKFKVDEYDGFETLREITDIDWITA